MRGHSLISSTDLDDLTDLMSRVVPGETLEVTKAGKEIDFSLRLARVGDIQLYHVFLGEDVPMDVMSEPVDRGDFLLCAPTEGSGRGRQGKEECEFDLAKGVVRNRSLPFHAEETGFGAFCLSVPPTLLAEHARAVIGDEAAGKDLAFSLQVDFTRPEARHLLNTMRFVYDELGTLSAGTGGPVVMGLWESLLMSQLLHAQPNSCWDRLLARPASGALPYHVKRARDYIHRHAGEKITLADLALQAGCGYRTLQLAFNDAFGLSPMAYLKKTRLLRVREDLLEADGTAVVAKIAARWGFMQMGRFTQAYRKQFGVSPSETLRRKT